MVDKKNKAEIVKSIQKIAKTPELVATVNKLNQVTEVLLKEAIKNERYAAWNDRNGSVNLSSGANAGAEDTLGVGNNGNPVEGPLAPPPTESGTSNATQGSTDAAHNSNNNNNIDDTGGGKDNDPSDKANDNGGGGGSKYTDQAKLGEDNEDWQKIRDALIAKGASAEEINQARIEFLSAEKGVDDVGDVHQGDAGAKPAKQNTAPKYSDTPDFNSPQTSNEVQRGLVGVSPDDHSQAMLIRMDGQDIVPTADDAAKADQNYWDNPGIGPVKKGWEQGYKWVGSGAPGGDITAPTSIQVANAMASALNSDPPLEEDVPYVFTGEFDGTTPSLAARFTRQVNGPFTLPVNRVSCTPGSDGNCPIDAPRETEWPQTGLFALVYKAGQFVYSQFDSEVPVGYKGISSVAKIHSLVTGEDYNIEPGVNGGWILYEASGTSGYFLYYNADNTLNNVYSNGLYKFYAGRPR